MTIKNVSLQDATCPACGSCLVNNDEVYEKVSGGGDIVKIEMQCPDCELPVTLTRRYNLERISFDGNLVRQKRNDSESKKKAVEDDIKNFEVFDGTREWMNKNLGDLSSVELGMAAEYLRQKLKGVIGLQYNDMMKAMKVDAVYQKVMMLIDIKERNLPGMIKLSLERMQCRKKMLEKNETGYMCKNFSSGFGSKIAFKLSFCSLCNPDFKRKEI